MRLSKKFGAFWPLVVGSCGFTTVFLFGLYIYMGVEGWSFSESIYQVVITLSTVGFQETRPLSEKGRMLTCILIVMGVGGFFALMASVTKMLIEGRLQLLLGRRKMQKTIDALTDHFIVCGFGRIGNVVAREIIRHGHRVVIVERDPGAYEEIENEGFLSVYGDATSDQNLLAAGLEKARVLITALSHEADNVYVTLTGRQLNPELQIVARAKQLESIQKLEFAGANRVLAPHVIGGLRMAQLVLRPTVTDFLELAEEAENLELEMDELTVSEQSTLADKSIIESGIRPDYDLIIIAIRTASGDMVFNPKPDVIIRVQDTLVLIGNKANIDSLKAVL